MPSNLVRESRLGLKISGGSEHNLKLKTIFKQLGFLGIEIEDALKPSENIDS
ncbi:MAG: hypothetical protein CENE_00071 [Candidatus Celerinatantimonas neptuna]|nr:MAG: hypothetical protein CENE_00071 [Candidatus Celerinatantimonas neptuna]